MPAREDHSTNVPGIARFNREDFARASVDGRPDRPTETTPPYQKATSTSEMISQPGIGNTPLLHLERTDCSNTTKIYAKAEFLNIGGSIKDRIVLHIIDKAEQRGDLASGATIVENTSGNTGAAVAMIAAQRGYKALLTMPDKVSAEKQALLKALGAEIVVCPTCTEPGSAEHYVERAKSLHRSIAGSFMINQYDNLENLEAHYLTTGPEVWAQMDQNIDIFVASGSTGGTISGTGRYLKEVSPSTKIVLLDPVGSIYFKYFHEGVVDSKEIRPYQVEGVGEDHLAGCMDFSVIDDVVRFTDDNAFTMTRQLARAEGLLCGGSSGANVWGAVQLAHRHPGARIATVLPDSGMKYMSKIFTD